MVTPLVHIVEEAQKQNKDAVMELVKIFQPLLKRYASYLDYDDAFDDLQLGFIEMILSISISHMKNTGDAFFLSYFQKSVYCNYIKISKAKRKYEKLHLSMSELTDAQMEMNVEPATATSDVYLEIETGNLKALLTDSEYRVIYQIFYLNNRVSEVAARMKISRQAVQSNEKSRYKKAAC